MGVSALATSNTKTGIRVKASHHEMAILQKVFLLKLIVIHVKIMSRAVCTKKESNIALMKLVQLYSQS